MKFNDFQVPALFSSTFKALILGEQNSRTFKDAREPAFQTFWKIFLGRILKNLSKPVAIVKKWTVAQKLRAAALQRA